MASPTPRMPSAIRLPNELNQPTTVFSQPAMFEAQLETVEEMEANTEEAAACICDRVRCQLTNQPMTLPIQPMTVVMAGTRTLVIRSAMPLSPPVTGPMFWNSQTNRGVRAEISGVSALTAATSTSPRAVAIWATTGSR